MGPLIGLDFFSSGGGSPPPADFAPHSRQGTQAPPYEPPLCGGTHVYRRTRHSLPCVIAQPVRTLAVAIRNFLYPLSYHP